MPSSPMFMKSKSKTDLAIEQFTRAIALKPNWSPLYRARAKVLQSTPGTTPRGERPRWLIWKSRSRTRSWSLIPCWPWTIPIAVSMFYRESALKTPWRKAGCALEIESKSTDANVVQILPTPTSFRFKAC